MDVKGVCYDTGRVYPGHFLTRRAFDPDTTRRDLDMTSTSLVKTYARGHGTTYPGMPWEPKQAFGAVASFYATH